MNLTINFKINIHLYEIQFFKEKTKKSFLINPTARTQAQKQLTIF